MKSQVRLLEAVNAAERMARGRLCVLSRPKGGGAFYHLQYRKDTKLHQRYVSRDEAPAYERATESYRRFMELVDAFVDRPSHRRPAAAFGNERRGELCRVARASVDDRQEHQHRVGAHQRQYHRGVGSMPTPKGRTGAADGMSLNRDSNASKRATTIRIGRWSLAAPLVDIAFGDSSLRSSGDTAAETLPTR